MANDGHCGVRMGSGAGWRRTTSDRSRRWFAMRHMRTGPRPAAAGPGPAGQSQARLPPPIVGQSHHGSFTDRSSASPLPAATQFGNACVFKSDTERSSEKGPACDCPAPIVRLQIPENFLSRHLWRNQGRSCSCTRRLSPHSPLIGGLSTATCPARRAGRCLSLTITHAPVHPRRCSGGCLPASNLLVEFSGIWSCPPVDRAG